MQGCNLTYPVSSVCSPAVISGTKEVIDSKDCLGKMLVELRWNVHEHMLLGRDVTHGGDLSFSITAIAKVK
jgi:hypothetical protein